MFQNMGDIPKKSALDDIQEFIAISQGGGFFI
jgi:hypothetical protein